MWSASADLGVFIGSCAVALALVALAPRLSGPGGVLPPWAFLFFVVGVDVAHVYSTLFRTYLDKAELKSRPLLYAGVPVACFAAGALLHRVSSGLFWSALAYVALTHFVRQQVGWVAVYRARAAAREGRPRTSPAARLERALDDATIYASTLYPVLYWHASLPREFAWFVDGDFVALPVRRVLPAAGVVYVAILVAYAAVAVRRALATRVLELGKHAVVLTTAVTWYVGIVATNSDFAFTAANVIVHGVPYIVFLWVYATRRVARADRARTEPRLMAAIVGSGAAVFVVSLQLLAFFEELVWDRLVWHSHPGIFGGSGQRVLSDGALAVLVPLLAVPQATHYVLDAVLWRRRDTGPAQASAMGFTP